MNSRDGVAALVMAGGRSERMRAGGSPRHKALRTVLGVPLIEHNLRALLWFGFRDVFVACNAQERELAAWLERQGRSVASPAGLTTLAETEPLGTVGAVRLLPREFDDALIVNVDNLTAIDLRELVHRHREAGAAATIATHEQPFPIPFGTVELRGQRVVAYREKPSVPVRISSGTCVLNRRAIDRVPDGRRFDVPALIEALVQAGEPVLGWPHQAPWIDVNDEQALAQAERLLADNIRRWPGATAAERGQVQA